MKNCVSKILCLLLCAATLFSFCIVPAAATQESSPVVVGYSSNYDAIHKGYTPSILVHIKDTGIKTSDVSANGEDISNIDITRLVDCFGTGIISDIAIESQLSDPLCIKFTVSNAPYSGTGNTLSFMLGYKNIPDTYNPVNITIRECVEYSAPSFDPEPVVNPMPVVQISRGDMETIKPGQEFTLTVTLTNTNKMLSADTPVISFSPSSAFIIADSTASKMIPDIQRNSTATVSIKLKALEKIEEPSQSVEVKVSFIYYAGDAGRVQGSATETVLIPVETSAVTEASAPLAVMTRGDIPTVKVNDEFTLNINVANKGESAMETPILSVSPDSDLAMMDSTMSRLLEDIQPGESVTVPVRLKARDSISSPSLSVSLELKYNYPGGNGSARETVYIPAVVNTAKEDEDVHIEGATPNVIISQYSYGESAQVAAGSTFDLALEFRNTSAYYTVENIVMTIGTGEGLTISSSSNTMYYASLRPGTTQSETLSITALPTAKTGSATLEVSFSYEYVDNKVRHKVSTAQNIAIPIYQPDRFEVELPVLPEFATAYEEIYISMPYVNKGKSEISNVRAELISPDGSITAINPVQNLGNFASGSSGTIDFIFSPNMSGQTEFSFCITYEDPNAQEKTLEFPVSLMVEEPYYPEYNDPIYDPGWEEPVEEGRSIPWYLWAAAGAVVLSALIITIVVVKKKRSRKNGDLSDFVWEDDSITTGGSKQ